jgi:hypothetical protein
MVIAMLVDKAESLRPEAKKPMQDLRHEWIIWSDLKYVYTHDSG